MLKLETKRLIKIRMPRKGRDAISWLWQNRSSALTLIMKGAGFRVKPTLATGKGERGSAEDLKKSRGVCSSYNAEDIEIEINS